MTGGSEIYALKKESGQGFLGMTTFQSFVALQEAGGSSTSAEKPDVICLAVHPVEGYRAQQWSLSHSVSDMSKTGFLSPTQPAPQGPPRLPSWIIVLKFKNTADFRAGSAWSHPDSVTY